MHATEMLSHEHRVIEQVLNCLERFVAGSPIHPQLEWATAEKILSFLKNFADRCHHHKEEEQLFPMLEARGFSPTQGPTAVMRSEHDQDRRCMAQMTEAVELGKKGASRAFSLFAQAAGAYLTLLRAHIQKEDHCLFPMAERVLSETDQVQLQHQFDAVEHGPGFEGEHETYLELADELAEKLGVPRMREHAGQAVNCCGHA
jgi:hemerythrin-like domain-containing protein